MNKVETIGHKCLSENKYVKGVLCYTVRLLFMREAEKKGLFTQKKTAPIGSGKKRRNSSRNTIHM